MSIVYCGAVLAGKWLNYVDKIIRSDYKGDVVSLSSWFCNLNTFVIFRRKWGSFKTLPSVSCRSKRCWWTWKQIERSWSWQEVAKMRFLLLNVAVSTPNREEFMKLTVTLFSSTCSIKCFWRFWVDNRLLLMADGSCWISYRSLAKIYTQFATFERKSHGNKGSIKKSTKEDL